MSANFTLRISGQGSFCSGVLISPDLESATSARADLVLTCAHYFRGKTGPFTVGGAHFRAHVLGAVRIPLTDLAVVRLDQLSPAQDLLGLSTSRAPWLASTITQGFGASFRQRRERYGRVVAYTPIGLSRNLTTIVRPGALLYNNPPAVRGDSGGPVIIDEEIVGVQSLIADPFGKNLKIATISSVSPHLEKIRAAVNALQQAYPASDA